MKKFFQNRALLILTAIISLQLSPLITFAATPSSTPFQVPPAQNPAQNRILDREGTYTYLAPIKFFIEGNQAEPAPGEVSDKKTISLVPSAANGDTDPFARYIRRWFQFLIGLSGVVAVVRLVMTGIKILGSAGSVDAKKEIKGELTAIITSLLLVAGSWVFLNTLNPALVTQNLLISPQFSTSTKKLAELEKKFTDDGKVVATSPATMVGVTQPGFYFTKFDPKTQQYLKAFGGNTSEECEKSKAKEFARYLVGGTSTYAMVDRPCDDFRQKKIPSGEKEARAFLEQNRIFPNKDPCPNPSVTTCTNIAGLSQATLQHIVDLSSACCGGSPQCSKSKKSDIIACPVIITGGTEGGHKTHGTDKVGGDETFDLRFTTEVYNFLIKNAEYIAPSFKNFDRYLYNGYWYTNEMPGTSNHHFHTCRDRGTTSFSDTCGKSAPGSDKYICVSNPENSSQKICKLRSGKICKLPVCSRKDIWPGENTPIVGMQ